MSNQRSIYGRKISRWGWIWVEVIPKGICKIGLGKPPVIVAPSRQAHSALHQIENYLKAKSHHLKFKINMSQGTSFQKSVWKALKSIPYGQVRSYKWIAQKIGRPKAFRAVGQACGANPLPLILSCHRVVANNGKIGGFSAGLQWKRRLLRLEGVQLK